MDVAMVSLERLLAIDVAEVYSPPRVTVEAAKFKLQAGEAMDLTTGWESNKEDERNRAEQYVDREKPLVLIGSPPCGVQSAAGTHPRQ